MAGTKQDWQSIQQRELSAAKARRTQRRGDAAVWGGAGLAAASYGMPGKQLTADTKYGRAGDRVQPHRQAQMIADVAREKDSRIKVPGLPEVRMPLTGKERLSRTGQALRKLPAGGVFAGGVGLAGLGTAGWAQGRLRERHHQAKINQRRKLNASKKGPVTKSLVAVPVSKRVASVPGVRSNEEGYRKDPSGGRMASGMLFQGFHGGFAGEGAGGKVKSAGSQLAAGLLGAKALGTAGSLIGGGAATYGAHRAGWLKAQRAGESPKNKKRVKKGFTAPKVGSGFDPAPLFGASAPPPAAKRKLFARKVKPGPVTRAPAPRDPANPQWGEQGYVRKADRDQNSSIGTSYERRGATGPHRKASLAAVAVGQAGGSERRPFAAKDQNSSISVQHVTPRRLDGKFTKPGIEHFTPKYRQGPKKPHDTFLGHYGKGRDKASKEFLGKADTGIARTGRRL